jgi:hypothetical protein
MARAPGKNGVLLQGRVGFELCPREEKRIRGAAGRQQLKAVAVGDRELSAVVAANYRAALRSRLGPGAKR